MFSSFFDVFMTGYYNRQEILTTWKHLVTIHFVGSVPPSVSKCFVFVEVIWVLSSEV